MAEALDLDAIRARAESSSIEVLVGARRTDVLELLDEVERLRTWAGLMSLLDEHYPASVFPTEEDREERDPGPRTISLIRQLDAMRPVVQAAHAWYEARAQLAVVELGLAETGLLDAIDALAAEEARRG